MPPVRTSGARYATDSEMATIDFVYPAISPEQGASKIVKKYLNRWRSYVEN